MRAKGFDERQRELFFGGLSNLMQGLFLILVSMGIIALVIFCIVKGEFNSQIALAAGMAFVGITYFGILGLIDSYELFGAWRQNKKEKSKGF